jgi:predicted ATPase
VQGNRPILIVLEDLQWADDATVLMLRDLTERLGGSRIVVLGTCWDTELDSGRPFAVAFSRMLRRRRAQRIALGRLSDNDVERMVAGLAETPLTPVALLGVQAATDGNPLFVEHSLLYIAESESLLGGAGSANVSYSEEDLELAQSVRGLIGRRIHRLSEPAQRMLVAAAIVGRDFDVPLLEAFGELSGHELREALEEATRGHFLVPAARETYRFAHDIVRQRVLAALPLPRLQAYHLAVADTLERVYGKAAHDHAAEIGYHLYQAGTAADPHRTATFLAQAANNALAIGAFEEVLRLVDSALQLLPADKIRERASRCGSRAGSWGLADRRRRGRVEGAIERYEELGETKAANALHKRVAHPETRREGHETGRGRPPSRLRGGLAPSSWSSTARQRHRA